MEDFPMQDITIYHKNKDKWDRYVVKASYRNTSTLNYNKNGFSSVESVLIRIFDINGYDSEWFASKEDVVVNKKIEDTIEGNTPLTQLSKKYGKENVHKITSISKYIFNDEDIEEINHIKIGAI